MDVVTERADLAHQDVASLIGASRQATTSVLNDLAMWLHRAHMIEQGKQMFRFDSVGHGQA